MQFRSARLWSNEELRRIAHLFPGEVVNVSASDDGDKEGSPYRTYFSSASSYSITNYTGYRGSAGVDGEISLDLTEELSTGLVDRFDVVFNHTTLEHIYDVRAAFGRLCAMSRDLVIVVVPFAQVTHWSESFGDYWRFTPMGVRAMFEEQRLALIYESAGPGRNEPIYLFAVGSRQPERWAGVLPTNVIDVPIGGWIGQPSKLERVRGRLTRQLRSRLG